MEITRAAHGGELTYEGGWTVMKRILTACLSLGAALAFAATAEAQDTTQTGAAPMPEDSAPTGPAQGDTLGGAQTQAGGQNSLHDGPSSLISKHAALGGAGYLHRLRDLSPGLYSMP